MRRPGEPPLLLVAGFVVLLVCWLAFVGWVMYRTYAAANAGQWDEATFFAVILVVLAVPWGRKS